MQAKCIDVNAHEKYITCQDDTNSSNTTVPYDKLIIACGAVSNTFGIQGVREHALFLKDISDARRIRHRVLTCFEQAVSSPSRHYLLNFAIVGAGPTGIEFAAELHDFIREDIRRLYPALVDKCRIRVFDIAPRILSSFDASLSEYTKAKFTRDGIQVQTGKLHKF